MRAQKELARVHELNWQTKTGEETPTRFALNQVVIYFFKAALFSSLDAAEGEAGGTALALLSTMPFG